MTDWPPQPIRAGSAHRRGGVARLFRRSGKAVLSLVSAVMLGVTGYGWHVIGDLNSGFATTDVFDTAPEAKPLDGAIDILLVGQDSRTDKQGNPLPEEVLAMLHAGEASGERQTDTMILVHIPQDGKSAVAISFPRDSLVEIAGGYGKHKLNSAFVYAYNDTSQTLQDQGHLSLETIEQKATVAGRRNLIATIEQFIGKPGMIDRYAEVNLSSFYEITKALGGIKVCLNNPVSEPKSGVQLPAGVQEIKGVQALAFVRQRYGVEGGDLGRIARQQAFLSGIARKVLTPAVLFNPARLGDLIDAVRKSVVLSEGWDLQEFAAQMRALTSGNVKFYTIPVVGNATIGGADVLQVEQEAVQAFVDDVVGTGQQDQPSPEAQDDVPAAAPSEVTVQVYNGSGNPALGKEVRQQLQNEGFQGSSWASAQHRAQTVVRYPPDEQGSLAAVREALGTEVHGEADSDIASGNVRLVIGADYQRDPSGAAGAAGGEQAGGGTEPPAEPERSEEAPPAQDPITAGGVPCVD